MEPISKFQGSLVGCAVGDALGAPVEAQPPENCRIYIREVLEPRKLKDPRLIRPGYEPFQYTDDTQFTRELALSIVEEGWFDSDKYAERLKDLYEADMIVGSGRSTRKALQRLVDGVHWTSAGEPHPAAGNGSAMRVAPIGLLYHKSDNDDLLLNHAVTQGLITHKSHFTQVGSALMAKAVSTAFQGYSAGEELFEDLIHIVDGEEIKNANLGGVFSNLLRAMRDRVLRPYHGEIGNFDIDHNDIVEMCVAAQPPPPPEVSSRPFPGISPYVMSSVAWALYAAAVYPNDFMKAIMLAIHPGGDVDTTAAMTGAIVGANVGLQGIPEEIATKVHDQGEQGYEFLCDLGKELHCVSIGDMIYR